MKYFKTIVGLTIALIMLSGFWSWKSDLEIEKWEAKAQADAAVKACEPGGAIIAAITVAPRIRL